MDALTSSAAAAAGAAGRRKLWRLLARVAVPLLALAVIVLVTRRARAIDWHQVGSSLVDYEAWVLVVAGLLCVASYAVVGGFDLLGRAYVLHRLRSRRVLAIAIVVYAFNLNFGAWVGSLGARYRLYSHAAVRRGAIAGIVGLALITNWLGWIAIAGVLLILGAGKVPAGLGAGGAGLGVVLLAVAGSYLAACAWSRRRTLRIRGFHVHLPHARLALTQLALGSSNWLLMAAIVWLLLQGQAPYPVVLGVLMASSIAGIIAHVPGGLGVIEAVFVAALGERLGEERVLAAIVAYRALYYIAPLLPAAISYATLETLARRERRLTPPASPPSPSPPARA